MAWRVLLHGDYAGDLLEGLRELQDKRARAAMPTERVHASALMLLAALQREGRFIDFVRQDVAGFRLVDHVAGGPGENRGQPEG